VIRCFYGFELLASKYLLHKLQSILRCNKVWIASYFKYYSTGQDAISRKPIRGAWKYISCHNFDILLTGILPIDVVTIASGHRP
jgi:hypothetical protein